jgi:hypothetical protein
MAGASIDHMVSLTILIAALLVAMMSFNQMFGTAVAYETNTQVATKAVDIMNTICLSPGNPVNWGETNDAVTGFGLQDPDVGGYALSPYSLMRLNTASDDSQLVYYGGTDTYYNNISTNYGHAILIPIGDCVNYTTASELLGINGTYGFNVAVTPALNITVDQVGTNPLRLNVKVYGSGMPLSGATLKSYIFEISKTDLSITSYSNITQTDVSGSVDIEFPDVTDSSPLYTFTVYVSLGGLNGVGYHVIGTMEPDSFIIPLVEDFESGDLILTHSWEITNPGEPAAVFYNADFFVLTSDFDFQEYDLDCSGLLTFGEGFNYVPTQIPPSEVGLLVVSYKANNKVGSVIVPWGVGALGVSASFGGGIGSTGSDFVATELRQVTVDGISYQVKVSAWKLGN